MFSFIGLLVSWAVYFVWKRSNTVDSYQPASPIVRLFLTGMLTFGWFIATSLGTFGQHAPAHSVGNQFLGVWFSFLLSLFLCKKTLMEYLRVQSNNPSTGNNRRTRSRRTGSVASNKQKKNKIPGLVEDDDEAASSEVGAPVSTGTEEYFETTEIPIVTPPITSRQPGILHNRMSSDPAHSRIAMSLEESFENEDQRRSIRQVPTEKTVETGDSFADEDDVVEDDASAKTARRGSSRRTIATKTTTAVGPPPKPTPTGRSTNVAVTSIPYAGGEELARLVSHTHVLAHFHHRARFQPGI